MEPKSLLLILLLFSGKDEAETAQKLSAGLKAQIPRCEVALGADAVARLKAFDLELGDLLASSAPGRQLTRQKTDLAIIHLTRREVAGDQVLELRLWSQGAQDNHTAIAGQGGDPLPSALRGVTDLLRPKVAPAAPAEPGKGDVPVADLAGLVRQERWESLLGALASLREKTPRDRYYEVLAFVRLNQRDAAVSALNALRQKHPDHFLVAAAQELIPGVEAAKPVEDGNALRDQPVAPSTAPGPAAEAKPEAAPAP